MKLYLNPNHLDDVNTIKIKSEILELVIRKLENEIIKIIKYLENAKLSSELLEEK